MRVLRRITQIRRKYRQIHADVTRLAPDLAQNAQRSGCVDIAFGVVVADAARGGERDQRAQQFIRLKQQTIVQLFALFRYVDARLLPYY